MHVTVIFEDNVIIVDKEALVFAAGEVQPAEESYKVIQWGGDNGYIERTRKEPIYIDDPAIVQPYIDQFAAKKLELEQPPEPEPEEQNPPPAEEP